MQVMQRTPYVPPPPITEIPPVEHLLHLHALHWPTIRHAITAFCFVTAFIIQYLFQLAKVVGILLYRCTHLVLRYRWYTLVLLACWQVGPIIQGEVSRLLIRLQDVPVAIPDAVSAPIPPKQALPSTPPPLPHPKPILIAVNGNHRLLDISRKTALRLHNLNHGYQDVTSFTHAVSILQDAVDADPVKGEGGIVRLLQELEQQDKELRTLFSIFPLPTATPMRLTGLLKPIDLLQILLAVRSSYRTSDTQPHITVLRPSGLTLRINIVDRYKAISGDSCFRYKLAFTRASFRQFIGASACISKTGWTVNEKGNTP